MRGEAGGDRIACVSAAAEVLALSDHRRGAITILEHYLERVKAGDVVGLMVVAETAEGGVELKQSSTSDAYRRLGLLDGLHDLVLEEAREG